jgi:hypothetical protein
MIALTPLLGLSVVFVPMLIVMAFSLGTLSRLANTWTCPECHGELHTPEHVRHAYHLRSPHVTHQAW